MDLNNFYNILSQPVDSSQSGRLTLVMRQVFLKMTLGLIVSALVALFAASSGTVMNLMYSHTAAIWILFLIDIETQQVDSTCNIEIKNRPTEICVPNLTV